MADRLFPDLDLDAITYRSTLATAMDALSLQVPIPSAVCSPPPEMACLKEIELQLRVGEMNDALEGIREQLALKAYLFRHKIRLGKTKKPKTRAWTAIQRESRSLLMWKKKYDAARTTLIHLGAPTSIKDIYHPLKDEDLKTVTGVVRCGNTEERRTTLPERSGREAVRSEAGATSATRKVEHCVHALPGPCCTEEERLGRGPERRGEQV